jgi:hypothetical protein
VLFIGLVIYLVLLYPTQLLLPFIVGKIPLGSVVIPAVLFTLSVLAGWAFYVAAGGESTPEGRRIDGAARTRGVRLMCLATLVSVAGLLLYGVLRLHLHPSSFFWAVMIPAAAVTGLNMLGVDIPFKREPRPEPSPPPKPEPSPPEPEPSPEPEPGPQPQPEPEPEPPKPVVTEESIICNYRWTFEDREYRIDSFLIRRSIYEECKRQARVDIEHYTSEYVLGGIGTEVRELARQLYRRELPFGTYREVSFVLAFVQQCSEYAYDPPGPDYPRYPVETLAECHGDCEDVAILGAAILKCMGYNVALLLLPEHCALGVAGAEGVPGTYIEHNGIRFYYCEMTGEGWLIGQLPEHYEGTEVVVYRVASYPVKVVLPDDVPADV